MMQHLNKQYNRKAKGKGKNLRSRGWSIRSNLCRRGFRRFQWSPSGRQKRPRSSLHYRDSLYDAVRRLSVPSWLLRRRCSCVVTTGISTVTRRRTIGWWTSRWARFGWGAIGRGILLRRRRRCVRPGPVSRRRDRFVFTSNHLRPSRRRIFAAKPRAVEGITRGMMIGGRRIGRHSHPG